MISVKGNITGSLNAKQKLTGKLNVAEKVINSGVDINDYFNDTIPNQGAGVPAKAVQFLIKKVLAFNFSGNLFNGIFKNMEALEEIDLSKCDFSRVENISDCFYFCKSLKQIDLSAINNNLIYDIGSLIRECSNLEKFDLSNCSLEKVTNCVGAFTYCPKLTELKLKPNHNLGKGYETSASENYFNYSLQFYGTQNLNHESLMNAINGLYDIASLGVKPQQLVLGSTNLAKLTEDEITIATNKGWTVS